MEGKRREESSRRTMNNEPRNHNGYMERREEPSRVVKHVKT